MPNNASSIRKHVLAVRQSLSSLDRSLARLAASLNGSGLAPAPRGRSSLKLSPRARASLRLQGRYMGYMRQLKPKQKAQVRAVKEKMGIEAAIRKARQLAM